MTPTLVQIDGLFWPASDERARPVLVEAVKWDVPRVLQHVRGRDVVVQAGGNVGLYPLALADHFRRVVTAEPDAANFACLARNLEARDSLARISAIHGAFGEGFGKGRMVVTEADNCGAHQIRHAADGDFAVTPIDALKLDACDLIYLDVEGCELPALKGAEATIARLAPVIVVEDKNHHRAFGIADGELDAWLQAHGYAEADRWANDRLYTRTA